MSVIRSAELIRSLEELSFNAMPSLHSLHYDGWILRMAEGYTKRANSVNPLYPSTLPIWEKLTYCEQVYAHRELPLVFKITEAAQPSDLDAWLESHGMEAVSLTSVQTLVLADAPAVRPPKIGGLQLESRYRGEWLVSYYKLNRMEEEHLAVHALMLAGIIAPTAYLTVRYGELVLAVGMAVLERGCLGIFDVVVEEQARGQGVGAMLLNGLLTWGAHQGAELAYLQVQQDNQTALNLYQSLGFEEAYRYWYRVQPA